MILFLALFLAATPASQFESAKRAYDRNEYTRVVQLLRPLLYPEIQLSSPDEVTFAHRLLGIAMWKTHDAAGAEREFSILLANDPDFRLDRLVDGDDVAAFVDRIRQRSAEDLARAKQLERERAEAERKKHEREEEERKRHAERIYVPLRVVEHSYAVNFLPLGAGQFQNGDAHKGRIFLYTGAVLGATSLGLWIAKHEIYPDGRVHTPSQSETAATALQVARIATGGAFLALWAIGVYDALRHYQPEELKPGPAVPMPVPLAGGGGLSFTGSF
jgi:hypothetical protein